MASSAGSAESRVPAGYTVVQELGSGRAGRAVLCKDSADRSVVVRLTGISGAAAPAFEAELRTVAAAASHPCAVAIPKVWTEPELGVCCEQAHCPGMASGPVDAEVAAVGGVRLTAALAHAHRLGLLHGDLRPDDVMLDADGNWLLADGGILDAVRRARPELAVDRDSLFSPRELRGWEAPAESADVYSLGATLRALLGDTPVEAGMDALLGRMLAPNPADRPSLVEVDEVLRAHVPSAAEAGLPKPPPGPRPAPVPPRPAIRVAPVQSVATAASNRRKSMLVAISIGAVFVVGAGAVAVANSGSDHGGATAAAATATLTPSPSATSAATTINMTALKPFGLIVTPKEYRPGDWRTHVFFSVNAVPAQLSGWRVFGFSPRGDLIPNEFNQFERPEPGTHPPIVYQYYLPQSVAFNSCVRVESEVGNNFSPSSAQGCPTPAAVKVAQAKIAAEKAAAKKAAAKKKS
jgi:hypothetical protein